MRFRHYLSQLLDTRRTRVSNQGNQTNRSRRLLLEQLEDRCVPAIFTVNTQLDTVDANPGDGLAADAGGFTSLRAAIMEANQLGGADEIVLPAGTYLRTILGTGENAAATGDLDIKDSLTLTGAGAATTIIDADGIDRVIEIIGIVPVTISGVTIRKGDAGTEFFGGGGVRLGFGPGTAAYTVTFTDCIISDNRGVNGGGINNDDTLNNSLVLVRTTVANNTAITDGGGIVHGPDGAGSLTLTDCIVSNNTADRGDGGIIAAAVTASALTITGSTISGNSAATGIAGGIEWFGSTFVLTNSTVSGNTTGAEGGGIVTGGGNVTVTNSTISGNTAGGNGGGIANFGSTYTLTNVTITNNVADNDNNGLGNGVGNGGGIFNGSGTVNLLNTIVGSNTDRGGQAPDCSGTITSQGHNLVQSTLGCTITGDATGNITGQDPQLGALTANGGPTLTHLPLAGSSAIDAGSNTGSPPADQRGTSRPQGAGVDIGAVEVVTVEAPPSPPPSIARAQRLTFKLVGRSAAFRNELGLFQVDSADGRIGNLLPGDAGYAAAALARRRLLFRRDDGAGTIRRLTLPAGAFFGLYLVQNGSSAEVVARNHNRSSHRRPQVFFSFTAANPDRFAHLRWLSARQFAFEDFTGGGDRDFNDLVARFMVAGA